MDNTYEIYQVKSGKDYRNFRFESIDSLEHFGLKVDYSNYDFVYKGSLDEMTLEDIFRKFNHEHPEDYKGRSLSVSDVVVLNKDGKTTANFVDSFGFKEVNEFILQRNQESHKEFSVLKALKDNKSKVESSDKKKNDIKQDIGER
ncbi:hypothetical protein EZV73_15170 [Acidaminobacter sp. JC074]|uniref:YodL domain-containing protein n=1 Tax=Acidaminobacter sp. JC074 TaxID=2530199 RepID=UPI001F0F33D4|nr:YodL domain-containing protein [Acidaminobacter sp. JC074]MCH4888935.1 hypothetical protein [Acidaminobacter sp. JC074]